MAEHEDRILAVDNMKGGVLKTTTTVNVAAVLASKGLDVLIFDLDAQGHVALDLGLTQKGEGDNGKSILNMFVSGTSVEVIKGVRPGIDVVAGGVELKKVPPFLAMQAAMNPGKPTMGALREELKRLAPRYDVILIDCPPGDSLLKQEIYAATRWVLFVSKPDRGSMDGLVEAASLLEQINPINPNVDILGAVVTDVDGNGKAIAEESRAYLQQLLGDVAPSFVTTIRHVQKASIQMRDQGRTSVELSRVAQYGEDKTRELTSIDRLYLEFERLAEEIARRFEELAKENV